jgi:metal-sulfur cluster biosynthetic enzyme
MEIISNDPAKCSIAITGLNQVDDPEIGLNIVDLGLIYQIDFDESDKKIYIQMTFSTPFCPMGDSIIFEVKQKMLENFSEYDIIINLSFDPPWSPDRISAKGKEFLNK